MARGRKKAETVIEEAVKVEDNKIRVNRREVLKKVSKSTEVVVMNNTNGMLYFPTKTKDLDIRTGGDTDIVTVEELQEIKNKSKSMFAKFYLVPVDVIDEGVALEEVIVYLGLDTIYNKDNLNMEEYMDNVINSTPEQFLRYMETLNQNIIESIAEKIADMYMNDEFDSSRKQQMLCDRLNNQYFFEDLKAQK